MRNSLVVLALLAAATSPAAAQVVTVDEGGFTITRGTETLGREQFKIASTPGPSGAVYVATATVVYADRRLTPALRADTAGAPIAYQIEVRVGAETQERLTGQVARGRISTRSQTPRGESAREYLMADGALILDDDVFHQYFFVARRGRTDTIAVVVPRRNVQVRMSVEDAGPDRVEIAGRSLPATHLVLTVPGSGQRDVWVDAQGRVLRVELRERGIVAVRDDPPR